MSTYGKYAYSILPAGCIRVLELQPASSTEAPLEGRISVQQIQAEPYQALSYVWGDKTPYSRIHCEDNVDKERKGDVDLGANLVQALLVFRLADRPRRIWVDAICINQEDIFERQSQVRLMGHVFSNAKEVLCWLAAFEVPEVDEPRARSVIEFLRRFNREPFEQLRVVQDYVHSGHGHEEVQESWLGIKWLFDIDYFHRAWIIQEVGLAQHARLYWGSSHIWADWAEMAAFSRFMDDNGASVINHFHLKSWVCNHINLVWEKKPDGQPKYNFIEVLHWARVHLSTDPRDYVYALLGHPSARVDEAGGLIVDPDYTISTTEAYTNLAVNEIKRSGDIQIMAFVDHEEDQFPSSDLPTWVPDWHALNLVAPLRSPTYAAPMIDAAISINSHERKTRLRCQGFLIDAVCAISDTINPKELVVTSLEAEMKKKTPFLIDHIWSSIVQPSLPPLSSKQLVDSLGFVLTGGFCNTQWADSGEAQHRQRADCAAFILKFEQIRTNGPSPGFLDTLPPEDRKAMEDLASQGTDAQFIQDMTWTSMCRRVFRTAKGHIGLGPRIMKNGDVCAVLVGAGYPMILRSYGGDYQLVGPALLYGFMNSEVTKGNLEGDIVQQAFSII
ncbi:hypothetical protein B7494_g4609 [Chlorociboria aeruginascens]|nr:hypothetical protein B7494_g4609 [Chlorociboria aeruginascens]